MTTRDKESSSSSSTSSVTDSGRPLAARGHAALENFYRSGQDGELSWRLCVLCRGIATWPIRLADHHVKTHGADCPVATLEAALAQERPNERSNTHPVADTGVTEPTHPSAAARVHALIAQWRERARRVRPLESEPVTAEKRERAAEWMHFTARAIELEAALAAALAPKNEESK